MRFAASLIVVALVFFMGSLIVKPWLALSGLSSPLSSKEELLRALSYDPQNPSYHYRLGLNWYYDPTDRDLVKARNSYITAINLNPVKAQYWLELAKVYGSLNDLTRSKYALDRALVLNPTKLKTRWAMVNHWLRQSNTDRAMGEIKLIIKDHPGERLKAFSLLHSIAGSDVEVILDKALPGLVEPMKEYLSFFMERKDTAAVKVLWATLSERFDMDQKARSAYVDYLITQGELRAAKREWIKYKAVEGEPPDIVWNSGFEQEISDWGFGWRMLRAEGVDVELDTKVVFAGKRSLRMEFDGKHNLYFFHVSQKIPLEPGSSYTLSANMKTENITTTNGIFIMIHGISGCRFLKKTEALTGTNDWTELKIELTTPPDCKAGLVRLGRARSEKFNNLIGGRAWVDGIRLQRVPVGTP